MSKNDERTKIIIGLGILLIFSPFILQRFNLSLCGGEPKLVNIYPSLGGPDIIQKEIWFGFDGEAGQFAYYVSPHFDSPFFSEEDAKDYIDTLNGVGSGDNTVKQVGYLAITVLDEDNVRLANAMIIANGETKTTGTLGEVTFYELPLKSYEVKISKQGIGSMTKTYTLTEAGVTLSKTVILVNTEITNNDPSKDPTNDPIRLLVVHTTGGTTSPVSQEVALGTRKTITATPWDGYSFSYWTKNGNMWSSKDTESVTVKESVIYKAVFYKDSAPDEPIIDDDDTIPKDDDIEYNSSAGILMMLGVAVVFVGLIVYYVQKNKA